jgi:hypothetical protein
MRVIAIEALRDFRDRHTDAELPLIPFLDPYSHFPVRRPVGLSGPWEGEAPASSSGVWTIMRVSAGLVPHPPRGRIISVSIRKWNQSMAERGS